MTKPPVENLALCTNFPSPKVINKPLLLSKLSKGKPSILHLYTGWGGCWPCAQFLDELAGSKEYGEKFNFILICCAGPGLAPVFGTRLQLKHVTNTVTLDQPQWGQLGCNGFIILDENGDVKLKKTLAFLQFRERAFQQVLELMNAMLSKSDTAFSAALKTKNYVMTGSGDTCDDDGEWSTEKASSSKCSNNNENGACDNSSGGKCGDGKSNQQSIQPLANIISVNVGVLDDEHELCANALARLSNDLNVDAVKNLFNIYTQHFTHEEELLDEHLYKSIANKRNKSPTGFSADANVRKSHYTDHARLLKCLKTEITRLESMKGGQCSISFVNKVLRDFENHANLYDDAYAESLSSVLNEQ
jgi:hemerythrin